MELEKLTKSQIVLLTLLVSFVTSIATGIVTVSLMEQAPPIIPQTINRVVERTVERVVPEETQTATVVTRERTVTVKETDLIAEAVARVRGSSLRVYKNAGEGVTGDFIARAVVVAPGFVIMPSANIEIGITYLIPQADTAVAAKAVAIDGANRIALLEVKAEPAVFPAATMASGATLGQTVVGITGTQSLRVSDGIVTSVKDQQGSVGSFETSLTLADLVPGAVITNTDGAVLGLYIQKDVGIAPATALINLVKSISSPESSE